jgi:hypothetical protein
LDGFRVISVSLADNHAVMAAFNFFNFWIFPAVSCYPRRCRWTKLMGWTAHCKNAFLWYGLNLCHLWTEQIYMKLEF